MALYVHGVPQVTPEDQQEYVALTTMIAIDGELVRKFTESEDGPNVDPSVRLYRLVEVGPLNEGFPEE